MALQTNLYCDKIDFQTIAFLKHFLKARNSEPFYRYPLLKTIIFKVRIIKMRFVNGKEKPFRR